MNETPYNSVKDERLQRLLQWLQSQGVDFDRFTTVSADAGFRRYFRLYKQDSSFIAVDAPPQYEDTDAFIDIAGRLINSGIRTPTIHCYSSEKGFLLIEDFGDRHLQQTLESKRNDPALIAQLYQQAIASIQQMQDQTDSNHLPVCDETFLRNELELFPEWYLETHLKIQLGSKQRGALTRLFDSLIESAMEQPRQFMHRDFHCRNLMLPEGDGLGVIDFQGAMHGPVTYDPVSLLKDVYIDLPTELTERLMEQHRATLKPGVDSKVYQRWFDLMGLQRHLKILGIFSRLNYRDNKSHYLANLPWVIHQIESTLADYPEFSEFQTMFHQFHKTGALT